MAARHFLGRIRRQLALIVAVLLACSTGIVLGAVPAGAAPVTFSNPTAINIADATFCSPCVEPPGLGNPYPSNIAVSGLTGTITKVTATLNNVTHGSTSDLDVLLVGPGGQKFILVSDAGGFGTASNATLTFDDAAASQLGTSGGWPSGTYRPTNIDDRLGGDQWPAPAPTGPYASPAPTASATLATTFNGISPNGTWSLYVTDDTDHYTGSFAGGWSLAITVGSPAPTTTALSSSANPAFTGSPVTFTAHVTKSSDSSDVTTGTVDFREGATTLASNVALNSSGVASFTTSALSEGSHTVSAFYSGDANDATSNDSVTEVVDNHTTVSGSSYCNTGTLTANDEPQQAVIGTATPYPSHIFVSNLSGAISKVTLTAKNVTEAYADDLDVLLVGPGGNKFVVVSDAGGGTAITNTTVTFDDDAASTFAHTTGGWGSGTSTSQPVNYNDGTDTFPSPAPSSWSSPAPTGSATFASVFGGTDPNGTWSLYVVDGSLGGSGSFGGGWCLNFTASTATATTTAVTSSANPSTTGNQVTFTAHVTAGGADVTAGTVTFKDGSAVIGSPTPLDGTGHASVSTSSLSEGTHTITASYNGSPGAFNISTGTLSQEVDNATVVSGGSYCNTGTITINDPASAGLIGTATPYPSRITLSGAGTIAGLTVTLKGVTHTAPGDIGALLVGPGGQTFKLVSDAGGTASISGVTVTFDDAASAQLPQTTAWTSGTFKPTDYVDGSDSFPAPAPSGPYGSPAPTGSATLASVFNGHTGNGLWSLYVVDDTFGDTGAINGGWCLTPSTPPTIHVPSDITATESPAGSGSASVPFTVTADGVPTPTIVCKDGSTTVQSGDSFTVGSHTIDCTATNSAGTDSGTFTITVKAAQVAPVITVPADITVTEASPGAGAAVDFAVTATGQPTPTIVCKEETKTVQSGDTFAAGVHTIDCTATNSAGTDSGSFTITVQSKPVITVPADITVTESPAGSGSASVPFTVTATGVPTPTIVCKDGSTTVQSGDSFTVGSHTIDCTATNSAGHDSGSFTITVNAAQVAPTIHVPADITVTESPAGSGSANVPFTVTADGEPAPTIVCKDGSTTVQSGDSFTIGSHTIDCTATNSAGHDSASFTITVNAAPIAPTLHVPGAISVDENPAGSGSANVPFTVTATGQPTPTIVCQDGATTVQSGDSFTVGVHTIDCTATNSAGHDSGSFTITVNAVTAVLAATAGNNQAVAPGAAFPTNLAVKVTDSGGTALTGVTVTFTVVPGSSTTSGTAAFAGSATATAISNGSGVATAPTLTAGSTSGPVTITATAAGGSATFTETVTVPGPARADLRMHLSAASSLRLGGTTTVTVTVTNAGPSAASKLLTALVLPRGYSVANSGGGVVRGQAVLFAATGLAKGATATYHVGITTHARGSAILAVGALSGTIDPNYRNNLAAVTIKTS